MKFDYIIGNPPYQDETLGDNKGFAPPIYDKFLDASFALADSVELIHPARFLFNAGSTPKAWNVKMLNDPHFKVLFSEQDSSKIFPNTDIKGGVAITYHDNGEDFGAIETFTSYQELNSILLRIRKEHTFCGMNSIIISSYAYHFTEKMHKDFPDAKAKLSEGHAYDLKSNVFDKLPDIFSIDKPDDGYEYIRILGRGDNERTYKYIRRDYVNQVKNLDKYKILLAKANGAGAFGEVLSTPIIAEPAIGSTESFLSIGQFNTSSETESCLKYIKTKFARALLGILKTTQDVTPEKWKYVPLQDFTENSDIDWTKSIPEIDWQLYKKYGLDNEEIAFIESHVKEMA